MKTSIPSKLLVHWMTRFQEPRYLPHTPSATRLPEARDRKVTTLMRQHLAWNFPFTIWPRDLGRATTIFRLREEGRITTCIVMIYLSGLVGHLVLRVVAVISLRACRFIFCLVPFHDVIIMTGSHTFLGASLDPLQTIEESCLLKHISCCSILVLFLSLSLSLSLSLPLFPLSCFVLVDVFLPPFRLNQRQFTINEYQMLFSTHTLDLTYFFMIATTLFDVWQGKKKESFFLLFAFCLFFGLFSVFFINNRQQQEKKGQGIVWCDLVVWLRCENVDYQSPTIHTIEARRRLLCVKYTPTNDACMHNNILPPPYLLLLLLIIIRIPKKKGIS